MNMNNVKETLKKNKSYLLAGVTTLTLAVPRFAFAETTGVSQVITTSFQTVVTDTLASIAAIAPIGITIFGAMYCWKMGKKFFSKIAQ